MSVVATPLLNAVVTKPLLACDSLLAEDENGEAEDEAESPDVEVAVDLSTESVDVRRIVEDVDLVGLTFDDEGDAVVVSEEALLVVAALGGAAVDEKEFAES